MAYLLSLAALPANVAILVDHEKEVLGLKEDTHEGIKKPSGRLLQGLQDIKKLANELNYFNIFIRKKSP